MRTIVTLIRKDLANFYRNRAAVVLTFVVPIALIYVFGQVFGLNRKDTGPTGIVLAVVNASSLPAAQKLVDALHAEKAFRVIANFTDANKAERPLTEHDARALIHDRKFRYAVVLPSDLLATDRIGLHLKILSDPRNTIEAQMVNGLLLKTILSSAPELLGQSLQIQAKKLLGAQRFDTFNNAVASAVVGAYGGDRAEILRQIEAGTFGLSRLNSSSPPDPASGVKPGPKPKIDDVFSKIVKIDQEQVVGKKVKNPEATRIIGGQAIMFLLFALSGSAAAFFDEKNAGLFQRLLSAPVTRAQLLWSRFGFGVIIGVVQLLTLFIAGNFMFGMDVFQHLGGLVVVCLAAAAACTAFGMLVAAFSPNAQAASGLSTLLVMMMASTGGAWFPPSLMPEFMQQIGQFTLVYWSIEGFLQVLWAGDSLLQVLPTIGVLLSIAIGVMSLAIWRLNRRNIFG